MSELVKHVAKAESKQLIALRADRSSRIQSGPDNIPQRQWREHRCHHQPGACNVQQKSTGEAWAETLSWSSLVWINFRLPVPTPTIFKLWLNDGNVCWKWITFIFLWDTFVDPQLLAVSPSPHYGIREWLGFPQSLLMNSSSCTCQVRKP